MRERPAPSPVPPSLAPRNTNSTLGISSVSPTGVDAPPDIAAELRRHGLDLGHLLSSLRREQFMPVTMHQGSSLLDAQFSSHSGTPVCPPQIFAEQNPNPSTQMYSLQTARCAINYFAADVPDPPALSFVRDLERLYRVWDDNYPQWDNSSPLHIRGNSIALVYWPKVYRYQGTRQWTGIKQRWFEWKVRTDFLPLFTTLTAFAKSLVTEYRALGSEEFWAKYSSDGKPLPITNILKQVKEARLQEDRRVVELAKVQYGDDFQNIFVYRKAGSSVPHVLLQPYAIANRYRKLNGLLPSVPVGEDHGRVI
jgi:hypothetical protein